jgi:hypothetical protein
MEERGTEAPSRSVHVVALTSIHQVSVGVVVSVPSPVLPPSSRERVLSPGHKQRAAACTRGYARRTARHLLCWLARSFSRRACEVCAHAMPGQMWDHHHFFAAHARTCLCPHHLPENSATTPSLLALADSQTGNTMMGQGQPFPGAHRARRVCFPSLRVSLMRRPCCRHPAICISHHSSRKTHVFLGDALALRCPQDAASPVCLCVARRPLHALAADAGDECVVGRT